MVIYRLLASEKRLIEWRLSHGQPVLGICLSAQLMAATLGARVYEGATKEIGRGAISLTTKGFSSPLAPLAQDGVRVLHWHCDIFDLRDSAPRLASNAVYPNQAFSSGDGGLALQFHIEADAHGLDEWYIGHAVELAGTDIDVWLLRRDGRHYAPPAAEIAGSVLNRWLDNTFGETYPALAGVNVDSPALSPLMSA
ncbi:glutamine amidotransferase [Ancylobacter sp. 6x-1]|uniref:Glutamine amidotransferase n=2 Tax=Ancylobacter crimeensis TaxID=2579147 RepID=A0ABT0D840_9HYPH|nr:glutamine amidotransferase [Ancylobacter crimeensis]MCK0196120.1 glutamine amidotransferase [Ancylobacter crimeensis]